MSDVPDLAALMALIRRVHDDAAFAAIVRAESKRTVCCNPADVDRIRWHVDQAGLGDVFTVVESALLIPPAGQMFVVDEQAIEAGFREAQPLRIWP